MNEYNFNFSQQLQNLVYSTPAINFSINTDQIRQNDRATKAANNNDMLNQLGLAVKRR